ncbi:hypothetical protein [Sphingobacterium faecium]|uniref:hypothetical protein n=1 Tax=Sphingobacterium faecium TaxID=34087 RepID=UPI002479DD2F|nr:hypothetical protein [Sphingobacterium faecium]WGQ15574.1 hypothetical protein QG727_04000 [Sphingobacterium faecium]
MGKLIGLKSLKLGPIGVDGAMGTVLTEVLGATVKGTASLVYSEPSIEDIEVEEFDGAYDEILTTSGKFELNLESYNVSAKTLGAVCGGEYTEGTAGAPDTWEGDEIVHMEMSAEAESRNGVIIQIPRLKFIARPSFDFNKAQLGRLILKGSVLKPTKVGVKSIKYTNPA